MIQKLTDFWVTFQDLFQKRLRWFIYILIGTAFVYILITTIDILPQIQQIPWHLFVSATVLIFFIYLLSLLLQFFIWTRILSTYQKMGINDLFIYFKVLILRRLPGGVWHWVGRATMYSSLTQTPSRVIIRANFLEWVLLIIVGISISIAGYRVLPFPLIIFFDGILLTSAFIFIFKWLSVNQTFQKKILESILWLSSYIISWGLGGYIIYLLSNTAQGANTIGLFEAIWVWAVSGSGSMLLFPVPMGLGIREISITLLLKPYLPESVGIIVALLIRLIFSLADVFLGLACWGLDNLSGYMKSTRNL